MNGMSFTREPSAASPEELDLLATAARDRTVEVTDHGGTMSVSLGGVIAVHAV